MSTAKEKKVVYFLYQETRAGRVRYYHENGRQMLPYAEGRFERVTLKSIKERQHFLYNRMIDTKIGRGYAA